MATKWRKNGKKMAKKLPSKWRKNPKKDPKKWR